MTPGERDPGGKGFDAKKHIQKLNRKSSESLKLTQGKGRVGKRPDQIRAEQSQSKKRAEMMEREKQLVEQMARLKTSIEKLENYIETLKDPREIEEARSTLIRERTTYGNWSSERDRILANLTLLTPQSKNIKSG